MSIEAAAERLERAFNGTPYKGYIGVYETDLRLVLDAYQRAIRPPAVTPPDDAVNHPSHYGGADNPYEAIKLAMLEHRFPQRDIAELLGVHPRTIWQIKSGDSYKDVANAYYGLR
jgi:hypothetical protein